MPRNQTHHHRFHRSRSAVAFGKKRFLPYLERVEDRVLLSTYTVNSLTDVGDGTGLTGDLRYAITQADQDPGSTIVFSITGTIVLASALPDLSANMAITGPGSL